MEQRHGAETKREESKLQTATMNFLSGIMGKTRRDRIRNIYIRGGLKMEEIQNQIEESRLRQFGHVERMDEHRIPKKIIGNEDEWKGQTTYRMDCSR
jgi:hypothetical protein